MMKKIRFGHLACLAVLVSALPTSSAWAQRATNSVKVTVKSFLGKIGDNTGSFGSTVKDKLLWALAKATDLGFSEDPQFETKDKKYRAFSEMKFQVQCDGNKMVTFSHGTLDTDTGKEGPLQAPPGVASGVKAYKDGNTAVFQWSVRAMPHEYTLPAFNAIQSRTSIWVWHSIGGRISCNAGRSLTSTNLTWSKFPSHRVYLNGYYRTTVKQGPFTNLWVPSFPGSTLVE